MRLAAVAALFALLLAALPVQATERVTLGFGRFLLNDQIGDGRDRWRTGSGVISMMRGPEGTRSRPPGFGVLLEYRFAGAVIAPASLRIQAPGDRPYAGVLSFGLHSHFSDGAVEGSLGFDLVATGPQSGMAGLQSAIHELLGVRSPSPAVLSGQIPDAIYPTMLVEMARPVALGEGLSFRPFVEAQAGVESFARLGADLLWGGFWQQGIFLRDTTTGQFYQSLRDTAPEPGLSLLIGADVAQVFNSALLPAADGFQLTPLRARARLGIHAQGKRAAVFYGLTWLGREFEAQPQGQLIGVIRFGMRF